MFAALLSMMDDESPARALTNRSDADVLHGGPVLAAEIRGHERLRALLATLADLREDDREIPDTFAKDEEI